MYCTNCGVWNSDDATSCYQCGNPMPVPASAIPQVIPNHLTEAILVTLCCCVPLGIPAIVYAAQVSGKVAAGDIQGALESSRKAKMWSWIGLGAGVAVGLVYLLLGFAGVVSEK
jgi:interferon-induced transmembrane protein